MKKEYYVDDIVMYDVIRIEEKLHKLYRNTILDFERRFSFYGCNIEITDCWTTDNCTKTTNFRPDFVNDYVCWICYVVLYNGIPIIYDNENSPITRSYAVLTISKAAKHHKHKFIFKEFDNTEDLKEELEEDLQKIIQMFSQSEF